MRKLSMARKVKIMQYATRRYDSQGEIAHAKTFQRGGGELTEQTLLGGIRGIHPVFKPQTHCIYGRNYAYRNPVFPAYAAIPLATCCRATCLPPQPWFPSIEIHLGRDIKKRESYTILPDMNRRKEVILLSLQCTRRGVDSGRHKAPLCHVLRVFRKFRILKLLAYCHPASRSHEHRKIGVERMMRESGKAPPTVPCRWHAA